MAARKKTRHQLAVALRHLQYAFVRRHEVGIMQTVPCPLPTPSANELDLDNVFLELAMWYRRKQVRVQVGNTTETLLIYVLSDADLTDSSALSMKQMVTDVYAFMQEEDPRRTCLPAEKVRIIIVDGRNRPTLKCGEQFLLKIEQTRPGLSARFVVETFTLTELFLDILTHELVPLHRPATDAERQMVTRSFSVTQLPCISRNDPQIRRLGLGNANNANLPGMLIKVCRPSETAGAIDCYRVLRGSIREGGRASGANQAEGGAHATMLPGEDGEDDGSCDMQDQEVSENSD